MTAVASVALAQLDGPRNVNTQRLVEPYVIQDATAALSDPDRHATGMEDVDLVETLADCRSAVRARLTVWLQSEALVASSIKPSVRGFTATVDVVEPVRGVLYVDYEFLHARRRAMLDITFLSPVKLTPQQRQHLVTKHSLVGLKQALMKEMRCAPP